MYRNVEIILYDENILYDKLKLINDLKLDFAYAYHDKDGVKPHYHLRIFSISKKSLSSWCKCLQVESHELEILQFKKLSIRYLIHKDNPEKHQYSKDIIVSNFNIDLYFNDKNTEADDVRLIIEFIDNCRWVNNRIIFNFIIENNLWPTYRRNYSILRDLIIEHNKVYY